jgi:methylated-DNA-protein-cysteine methyltransferase-like protein
MRRSAETSYLRIWKVVERIPRGRVATYGQIAALAGRPSQARLVGYALHNTPEGMPIPWQRVINAKGSISFPPSHPHHHLQKKLLQAEGILFRRGSIDLERFGWRRKAARKGVRRQR